MKLYISFAINAFQSNMAYRADVLLRIVYQIIALFVQIPIWYALLKGNVYSVGGISLSFQDMITYVILSGAISIVINNSLVSKIDNKIRTGEIAMDFIKPMNFKVYLFSEMMGNTVYRLIFEFLPMIFISLLLFVVTVPPWQNFALFIAALVNGIVLHFFVTYLIGLLSFWYFSAWHFAHLLDNIIKLFSGSLIPLWFFPKALLNISNFLPFKLIYFAPISIYLNKTDSYGALILIAQQYLWIFILFLLGKFVWRKAIKKLVIQGG